MLSKLKSRKLWATVAGAALLTFGSSLGVDDAITAKIVNLLMAYIGGQSIVDAAAAIRK